MYIIYIYMYTHINVLMFTLDFKTLAIFECRNCTVRIIQPRPFKSKVFPRTCLFRTVWRAVFQLDLNSLQSFNGGAKYLFSKSRSCIRLNVSMKGLKGLSLKPTAIGVNPFNWFAKSLAINKHPNKKHELRVHSTKKNWSLTSQYHIFQSHLVNLWGFFQVGNWGQMSHTNLNLVEAPP